MPRKKKVAPVAAPPQEPVTGEPLNRSRYEDVTLDEAEEVGALHPFVDLERMTKDEISAFSMRRFGQRPAPRDLKASMVAEVKDRLRSGRPTY